MLLSVIIGFKTRYSRTSVLLRSRTDSKAATAGSTPGHLGIGRLERRVECLRWRLSQAAGIHRRGQSLKSSQLEEREGYLNSPSFGVGVIWGLPSLPRPLLWIEVSLGGCPF